MSTEQNQNGDLPKEGQGEETGAVAETPKADVSELKELIEKQNQTIASLSRSVKKFEKAFKDDEDPAKTPEKITPQSNELDYAKKAFLNSLGHSNIEDQKWLMEESKNTGKDLDQLLGMNYVKEHLTNLKTERDNKTAMPHGSGRTGTTAHDEVSYYLAHPELTPPTQELHEKVIDAKIKAEGGGELKFADTPYIG